MVSAPTGVKSACRHVTLRTTGTWGFPGGRLEFGEEILACAARETLEETGLAVEALKLVAVTNTVFHDENAHYITLYVVCRRREETQQPEASSVHVASRRRR